MKYGLVLEGGGAKGAYHIGAVKALLQAGYEIGAITGASIGAINGAMIVQGDINKIEKIWQEWSFSDIFDFENEKISKALNGEFDFNVIKYLTKQVGKALKNGGIDTEKIRALLVENIDEQRVRSSNIEFGLVTICLSEKQAEELFIEDIPEGMLVDYIMASASLPVFKSMKIGEKQYLDGGMYDNCPVHMLEKKGYKNVIAIRTYKKMRIRDYKNIVKRGNVKIQMISPIDMLPNILNFDRKTLDKTLNLGYYDALKSIENLDGYRYYVKCEDEKEFFKRIVTINPKQIEKMAKLLNIELIVNSNITKTMFEKILPFLVSKTKLKFAGTYKESVYAIVEQVALVAGVKRFRVYESFDELLGEVKKVVVYKDKSKIDEALCRFVKGLAL
ncbi:MAG: patatin-like phospholipase family protein [Clostridia bacterium]